VKADLVFDDWRNGPCGESIYGVGDAGVDLIAGPFHHGSIFPCEITMAPYQEVEIRAAIDRGATPVFWLGVSDRPPRQATPGAESCPLDQESIIDTLGTIIDRDNGDEDGVCQEIEWLIDAIRTGYYDAERPTS
jgi:hypothetical protein